MYHMLDGMLDAILCMIGSSPYQTLSILLQFVGVTMMPFFMNPLFMMRRTQITVKDEQEAIPKRLHSVPPFRYCYVAV